LLPAWAAGTAVATAGGGEGVHREATLLRTQNEGDWLADWQRNLWTTDKQAIIVGTTSYMKSDRTGVWVRDGDHPRFSGNREYKKPIEFFFGRENKAPNEHESELVDFNVEDLGGNHTLLSWSTSFLRGVILRVRKLGDRWVGVFLHQGRPAVSYFFWAKTKRNWLGVDQGLDYISLHGYWVDNCQISDQGFAIPIRNGDGAHWELKHGMDDPLAACAAPGDEEPKMEVQNEGDSRPAAWPLAGALVAPLCAATAAAAVVMMAAMVVVRVARRRRLSAMVSATSRGQEEEGPGMNEMGLVS